MVDNVIVIDDTWATKIFTGSKTIEVRGARPPRLSSGVYGVAITGIPDLVVGRVTVTHVTGPSTVEEIALREEQTMVPPEGLIRYLRKGYGFCWHLSNPCFFVRPILFYSDGQTTKGAPRNKGQPAVEAAILSTPGRTWETEASVTDELQKMRRAQRMNKEERKAIKSALFREERALAAARRQSGKHAAML